MKKITSTILILLCACAFGQSYSSGNINFANIGGVNYAAMIETDVQNVTLTLTGPSGRYLGIGFGVNAMSAGGDVLIFDGTNLTDRTFNGNSTPTLDAVQSWTIISNTINDGVRTLVARRPLNSGQNNNFVFSNNGEPIMLVWAAASSNSFALSYHGSNRGATMSNFTLSQDSFNATTFGMYPNPANSMVHLELPENIVSGEFAIYDMMGKKVHFSHITPTNTEINVSNLSKGTYLSRVTSDGFVATKILLIN